MTISLVHYQLAHVMSFVAVENGNWGNLSAEEQFNELPQRYNWFECSSFGKQDKSECENVLDYVHARENLRERLKHHDFTYDYSDDHSVWERGRTQRNEINELGAKFCKADFNYLWNLYAPVIMKRQ